MSCRSRIPEKLNEIKNLEIEIRSLIHTSQALINCFAEFYRILSLEAGSRWSAAVCWTHVELIRNFSTQNIFLPYGISSNL